ncbi:MAG: molybdopterin-guanine dinucleotide biosynthesis protein MobB [Candidatus Thermoplasmatota archaeon]|nr:molybdopterin-guanine dinucleotide biosynthesis protein MobB [Candidatus Thermoplasmatota archaeon]
MLDGPSLPSNAPFSVNVAGLKKSGKTSVVEGIVAELRSRGYLVGTIKSMLMSRFDMDVKGKDTCRHGDAGASFTVSLSMEQTVSIERHPGKRKELKEVMPLFGDRVQFVICEGVVDISRGLPVVLSLRSPQHFDETVAVRGIGKERIIGISGPSASVHGSIEGMLAFDIMDPSSRAKLCDIILKMAGNPLPRGEPGGPLIDDPHWRPGVLPPGVFPEIPQ